MRLFELLPSSHSPGTDVYMCSGLARGQWKAQAVRPTPPPSPPLPPTYTHAASRGLEAQSCAIPELATADATGEDVLKRLVKVAYAVRVNCWESCLMEPEVKVAKFAATQNGLKT